MKTGGIKRWRPPNSRGNGYVRLVTASVSVSALGTWSYNVGIAVYAWRITHSANWVAAATVGRYVPALLLTWLGSRWIDRLPCWSVAVGCDLLCAAAMVVMTVVAVDRGPIVVAIALAAVSSAASRVQSSAVLSVAADIVVESQLVRSTLLISSAESLATAIGPAFASALLTVYQPSVLFAVNGFSFLVSAVLLKAVEKPPAGRRMRLSADSAVETAASDEAYSAAIRTTWPLLATRAIAALVYGFDVVLLAVIATRQLRGGTASYGLLLAAAGAGGLLVAVALRRSKGNRAGVLSSAGMAMYALPVALFALRPDIYGSLAVQLLRGVGAVMVTAPIIGGLQRTVPSSVSGRIFGLNHTLVLAGTCTGASVAPFAINALSLKVTLLLAAFIPFGLQLIVVPAILRFDQSGDITLAAQDPRVDALRRLDLFRDASRATLYDVADSAVELWIDADQEIVREGDAADALYVLVAGEVTVSKHSDAGPVLLRRMVAPDYFGEIGLIRRVPRTATVTSAGGCRVWRIPAATFLGAASQAGLSGALAETVRVRVQSDDPAYESATSSVA